MLLKKTYFCLLIFLIFFSCQKEETNDIKLSLNNKNFVSEKMAINAANVFTKKYHDRNSETNRNMEMTRAIDMTRIIQNVFTFKTEDNQNAFYAINYVEGGFVVVCADNRVSPIMAFSDVGTFSNNFNDIPDPVVSWMEEEKESIKYIIDNQLIQKEEIKLEWDYVTTIETESQSGRITCATSIYQKGPLMTTTWGQGDGYNNAIPAYCPNANLGNKPYTGCVATAMAQVLKYHSKPGNFNYAQMPNNFGAPQTQALMYAAGLSVAMSYGCSSSGANSGNIPNGFRNNFRYSAAAYLTVYSPNLIYNQILANKPVILTGGRKRNGITYPWNYYDDGHAWVADGALFIHLRAPNANGTCLDYGFRFLYMNWGWRGEYNAWYNENNFNPGTSTFNYRRETVYNITP